MPYPPTITEAFRSKGSVPHGKEKKESLATVIHKAERIEREYRARAL